MRGHLARLVGKTAGIGRLTAAGLFFREMNADAFAFEQGDGIHAGAGKELVDHAGGEEIDICRALAGFCLFAHFVSVGKLVKPIFIDGEMYVNHALVN